MLTRAHAHAFAQMQRGLSLIEMMISITIGLLILSSMATLFSSQSKVRSELDKSNRMIDNGRYALEVLSDNLRMAGFYGNYVPSGTLTATEDPCDLALVTTATTTAQKNLNVVSHHVQGYNAATAVSVIAGLPAACVAHAATNTITTFKDGSDILVLRRASTATPVAAANATAAPNSANTIYLQVSNCSSDTAGSFQIARGNATLTGFHDKDCTATASLRPFIVQAYFVSPDNNAGDGIPTLKRVELDQATGVLVTTPLVEGIEYMQVEYGVDGVDTDADGIPDRFNATDVDGAADAYIPCLACTPAQWSHVVSVKINIVARNIDPTAGYTDTKTYSLGSAGKAGPFNAAPYNAAPNPTTYPKLENYKRHAYTQVVRLVNPSGRL